jgi:serine/threonine protein kinase
VSEPRSDGAVSSSDVGVGDILGDRYRLERLVGPGGISVAYAGWDVHLDRAVVIRLIREELYREPAALEQLLQDLRLALQVNSPALARLLDAGMLSGNRPFVVFEQVDGEDLGEFLGRWGALPVERAADLVLQACEGLAEVHRLPLVHRELKPSNLLVTTGPDGALGIKILGLGLAHDSAGAAGRQSAATAADGAAHYWAPEQVQGGAVDARADVWALGALLYQMVSGVEAFRGATWPQISVRVLAGKVAPLSSIVAGVSPEFERVVERCLARDAELRFTDVVELAEVLVPFGTELGYASYERLFGVTLAEGPVELDVAPPSQAPGPLVPLQNFEVAPLLDEIAQWGNPSPALDPSAMAAAFSANPPQSAPGTGPSSGGFAGSAAAFAARESQVPGSRPPSSSMPRSVLSPGVLSPGVPSPGVRSPAADLQLPDLGKSRRVRRWRVAGVLAVGALAAVVAFSVVSRKEREARTTPVRAPAATERSALTPVSSAVGAAPAPSAAGAILPQGGPSQGAPPQDEMPQRAGFGSAVPAARATAPEVLAVPPAAPNVAPNAAAGLRVAAPVPAAVVTPGGARPVAPAAAAAPGSPAASGGPAASGPGVPATPGLSPLGGRVQRVPAPELPSTSRASDAWNPENYGPRQ